MTHGRNIERLEQWVTMQAARRPDARAIVLGDEHLTYGQLEDLSNRIARCLIHGGCQRGDRVGLLMPKSPAAIAGIIGIYKAGCIYVPLDPAGPEKRLAAILHSCEPRWILAAGPVADLLDGLLADETIGDPPRVGWLEAVPPERRRFRVEFSGQDLEAFSGMPFDILTTQGDPAAHILYTSGSTGMPKGVIITHPNVIHFVEWAVQYFDMRPGERISGHTPLYFDLSVFDIFGTFAAGGELHLVPPDLNMLPNKLAEFIRTSMLTQLFSVPSILNYMAKFDAVRFNDFPNLRRLLWCGEVFPVPAVIYWMQRLPHVRFTNLYGPTETTIASSYYTLPGYPDEASTVPIGTGCPGEELLVLGDDLRPLPAEEVGELYVRGVGLSPGYWRDPERTRIAFISDPHSLDPHDRLYRTGDRAKLGRDGLVYFLGRIDSQIKSRGYRIELGEIEHAVGAQDGVAECAVVAITTEGFEGAMICCAYATVPGAEVTPARLRLGLSRVLPSYMLPFRWLACDALPRNPNGKIDRRKLTITFQAFRDSEAQAPR